ncbi:MAG: hypothetical protein HY482_02660 [Candidatus Wildermuthbacteria bacterium]|nr:hypothetical protein [Candidatus Wildermuthbacteria bacterium]
MGANVAYAVAEEVAGSRPDLLSIGGEIPTFRFQGGVVVKVYMVNLDQFTESWRTPHSKDFVVTHCEVRYYPRWVAGYPDGNKVSEVWGAEKLLDLKTRRQWHDPRVVHIASIKGSVGVFINAAADTGYISVDPEKNQDGYSILYDKVEYARFVEGDLDRAKEEAQKLLDGHLTVNG